MRHFNRRCIVLYSGGLDSLLATLMMKKLGFEVYPLFIKTPFYNKNEDTLKESLLKYGLKLHIIEDFAGYIQIVKNPIFNYGKHLNPCIDCKIFFLSKAKEFMNNVGATFIVTGDVIGQRPMSQRSYAVLKTIEKHADVEGIVLRPLSGACLQPTLMEQEGIIERSKLLCIKGRQRKQQFKLAKSFGIDDFESPAGGCLLTDKQFSIKLKDAIEHNEANKPLEIQLLFFGRHFRIDGVKFAVSRREEETKTMRELFSSLPNITAKEGPGGVGVFLKTPDTQTLKKALSIMKRYSQKTGGFTYTDKIRTMHFSRDEIEDIDTDSFKIGGLT